MAVKDHSLDEKIVNSAKSEFLKYGFEKASLRKIAENAGITTGALYTRYKNKDVLFMSLLTPVFREMEGHFQVLKENYLSLKEHPSVETVMNAIRKEEELYLNLLFEYYDECVLFFSKSEGSTVDTELKKMMDLKSKETVQYFKSISKKDFDADGISAIMTMQFYYYRQILEKGYTREKAFSCMKSVSEFLEAGWRHLFETVL